MRAIVLSDLHLGATAGATDDAFVSFLEWLAERAHSDAEPWRLILLGDFLDLLHAPAGVGDPLAALDAVAAQHMSVLAALGAAAADGIVVDLIPGNHDSELADPDLQERLRALVADAAGTSASLLRPTFRVRPWFLLVPGLLYAEHGSQYHALNAVADPLSPFGRWSRRLPPGAVLDLFFRRAEHGGRARALPRLTPAGTAVCSNACVNTKTDPANCGGCGIVCGAGATCVTTRPMVTRVASILPWKSRYPGYRIGRLPPRPPSRLLIGSC